MKNVDDEAARLARAAELHRHFLTLDGHLDLSSALKDPGIDGETQFDLPKVQRGKLSGSVLTVTAPSRRVNERSAAEARKELEERYTQICSIASRYPDCASIAYSPTQFRGITASGRHAIVLGFQNGAPLLGDLMQLDYWIDRGVQLVGLTHIGNNSWADSSRPFPFIGGSQHANGLTGAGQEAVKFLNSRGVMIDTAQVSSAAFWEIAEISNSPILNSHTSVRAMVDCSRNMSDAELEAIRQSGGLVNMVGFSGYLVPRSNGELISALRSHWQRYGLDPPDHFSGYMTVNDVTTKDWPVEKYWTFRHEYHDIVRSLAVRASTRDLGEAIDYTIGRIGVQHVGVASDFNHNGGLRDWKNSADSLHVTAELIRRGYAETDMRAIWGENFLRVWECAKAQRANS